STRTDCDDGGEGPMSGSQTVPVFEVTEVSELDSTDDDEGDKVSISAEEIEELGAALSAMEAAVEDTIQEGRASINILESRMTAAEANVLGLHGVAEIPHARARDTESAHPEQGPGALPACLADEAKRRTALETER